MQLLTVSSKGQISIPKALRERLNLSKGTRLNVEVDQDRIILSKLSDWRSLRGIAAGADLLKSYEADKEWEQRRRRSSG